MEPPEPAFRRESERTVYDGHVISLAVGTFRAPDGSTFERDVVHHPGAVGVLPVDERAEAVLVRQYRAALDTLLLEIPAGVRDVDGEPPEVTAARELAEEVGLAAGQFDLLCRFHNSPGFADEEVWVYLATDLRSVDTDLQGIEEQHMTIERMALGDGPARIAAGEITDAKTVIGLLLALDRFR